LTIIIIKDSYRTQVCVLNSAMCALADYVIEEHIPRFLSD